MRQLFVIFAILSLLSACSNGTQSADTRDTEQHLSESLLKAVGEEYYKKGSFGRVTNLVTAGADVNAVDEDGSTPLHLAARNRCSQAVRFLITNGAGITTKNNKGDTPLHEAARNVYQTDIVMLLLDKGADINAVNTHGFTPLDYAIDPGGRVVGVLQKAGGRLGKTAAPHTDLFNASVAGDTNKMTRLFAEGVNPNVQSEWGVTALHLAGSPQVVDALVTEGANIAAKTKPEEHAPLHWATMRGYREVVEALLAKGADIEAKDLNGFTALHHACDREVTILLIASGADINVMGKVKRTPLNIAIGRNDIESAKLLLEKGASVIDDDLCLAAADGNTELLKLLIARGGNVNGKTRGNSGASPLHYAAASGSTEAAEVLISAGAEVNVHAFPDTTPFDRARTQEMKAFLRKHGAKTANELQEEDK